MKSKPVYLVNEQVRKSLINTILDEPLDGTRKVTLSNAGTKSAKQRGLQWMWYEDVVKSGIGGKNESSEERLHDACKWRWALPILCRDDDNFADLYLNFHERWKDHRPDVYADKIQWFVKNHVSTESLDKSQMAEYLTNFHTYYALDLGVNLRDPDDFGWAGLLGAA